MTSILANRTARRRGIVFTVLLIVSALLMAFSSNPAVQEVQNGIGFAFRPIQVALDQAANDIASVAAAIVEIDRLRVDNAALHTEPIWPSIWFPMTTSTPSPSHRWWMRWECVNPVRAVLMETPVAEPPRISRVTSAARDALSSA